MSGMVLERTKTTVRAVVFLFYGVFPLSSVLLAGEPQRVDGLSVHMLPRRIENMAQDPKIKSGFIVSQSRDLKPYAERPVFDRPKELIGYFKTLSAHIQENGIWVIVTHPDAYSEIEIGNLELLKKLCKKEGIPLFICRGKELPNGWRRYSGLNFQDSAFRYSRSS